MNPIESLTGFSGALLISLGAAFLMFVYVFVTNIISMPYRFWKRDQQRIKSLSKDERRAVRLEDAIYWVIDNSDWNTSKIGRDGHIDQAEINLRQAAKDGEIIIRGRKEFVDYSPDGQFDKTWDDIEPTYWKTHKFEMTAVIGTSASYAMRETVSNSNDEDMPHYGMLRIWRDELEKLCPQVNT